jgi:hypothetical protein
MPRREQDRRARIVQRERSLIVPVETVDRDEDRADRRGGELYDRPLGAIGRADGHAVSGFDAAGDERTTEPFDDVVERGVRIALLLLARDERIDVAVNRRNSREIVADRPHRQRGHGWPSRISRLRHQFRRHQFARQAQATAPLTYRD